MSVLDLNGTKRPQRIPGDQENAIRVGFAARPPEKIVERLAGAHLSRGDMQHRIEPEPAQRSRRLDVVATVVARQEGDGHVDARAEAIAKFGELAAARRDLDRSPGQQGSKVEGEAAFVSVMAKPPGSARANSGVVRSRRSRR